MAKDTPDGRGELYRMYDEDGRLLYVGISTTSALNRIKRHAQGQRWWSQVREIQVERVPLAELAEAERHAIAVERPLCNVVHNNHAARLAYRPKRTSKPTHLLSEERVARLLDVGVRNVRQMVAVEILHPVHIGDALRFHPAEVARLMEQGTPQWFTYSMTESA